MLTHNLSFLDRMNLKLVSKLLPVRKPEVLLLDKLEISLRKARVSQISIPSPSLPEVTSSFCPGKPRSFSVKIAPSYVHICTCQNDKCGQKIRIRIHKRSVGKQLRISCPTCKQAFEYCLTKEELTYDFTAWLKEQLFCPEIKSFAMLVAKPKSSGKSYGQVEADQVQLGLFGDEEDGTCIHGIQKKWCAICSEKEKEERQRASSCFDLFDLIFPLLQPPLGESFDSPIAFPPGSELYDFQRLGVKFLVDNERALLADEMGLGKSIQTIVAIKLLFHMGEVTVGLVLCPRSVLTDWEKKLWEWAPEVRVLRVRGSKEQRQIIWNSPSHLYLTTYETYREDLTGSLERDDSLNAAKKQFDLVVLDEIQKIKNPSANVTKACRMIDARIRWGLSGTPLENRLEELISVFAYLKPGLLRYDDAKKPWQVTKAIKPFFLRRRKSEALPELPEKFHEEIWLELSPGQREAYDRAEQEGVVELNEHGDSVTVQHVLALITKLKQICNMDMASRESSKLEYLIEKLDVVSEQGEKALVFSQYPQKTIKALEPELRQFKPYVYHGSLSDSERDRIVRKFQEEEEGNVLLMSVRAGSLGLTLTRASYVYHFDLWWNPSVAAQAEDRAHRIGQTNTVFVTSLFTRNTIEERIHDLLKRKRSLFKQVIDDLSDTNLSNVMTEDELFGLFNLKKEKTSGPRTSAKGEGKIRNWNKLSPKEFENLVAKLYEQIGYQVRLTPQTRDKGIDIHAKRTSETGTEYLAIQCKHYPDGVVGVEHARALYGVIQDKSSITKGILITSGGFSRDCTEFSRGKRIELFGGSQLKGLLMKYGIR